jgi:8-hydroxy-5-deazaflavin:NADPH oxidoreductase
LMKVGVLGAGVMGAALGKYLAGLGRAVMFGSRTPEKARGLPRLSGFRNEVGTYREAVAYGDLIVLATRWAHTREVVEESGPFYGKILLDCTNPETPDARGLVLGHTTSGAEEVAKWARGARVVKAFNHVYAELLDAGPRFYGGSATVFYCGDDAEAKACVARLAEEGGFDPVDAGPLRNARYLEPAAQLMVQLVRVQAMGPSDVALKLLRRS